MNRLLFIIFFFLKAIYLFSQIEISTEIQIINGKPHYIHEIKQGQTVYSIALTYQVSVEEIFEVNSFARQGIKTGQFLKIPVKNYAHLPESDITKKDFSDTIFLLTYIADENISISLLAQRFNLFVNDIIKYNPEYSTREIVKVNEVLRLPVKTLERLIKYLLLKPQAQVIILITHEVQKKETVFSIARQYGCSVKELESFNPSLEEKIKKGQILLVPSKDFFNIKNYVSIPEVIPVADCKTITEKKHYHVAFLLPLYLEKATSISIDNDPRQNIHLSNHLSFEYIQFYEGLLIALEHIDFNNAVVSIDVYDVTGEEKINTLISRGLLDVDVIIGPFITAPFMRLCEWAKDKNVKIIDLTLSEISDDNTDNPNRINIMPSIDTQLKNMLLFIKDFETSKNIIFTYNINTNEKILYDKIKAIIEKEGIDVYIDFFCHNSQSMSELIRRLSSDRQNIIINFSNNEAFFNNFIKYLFDNAQKFPVTLFGLPSWLRFESIDLHYLNHFNTHFFSSQFINYSNENVLSFVSSFQDKYKTDPTRMAFLGYDIATYFLGILTLYGNDFIYCLNEYKPELLSANFVFDKHGETTTLQNKHVFIYEMIEFNLFDVRRRPKSDRTH